MMSNALILLTTMYLCILKAVQIDVRIHLDNSKSDLIPKTE